MVKDPDPRRRSFHTTEVVSVSGFLTPAVFVLKAHGAPHSLLQKRLLLHFARFEQELKFLAIPECRTKVEASRYRIPDVVLVSEPVNRKARFYGGVPLTVIEILSPDDSMKVTLDRFRDYQALGVKYIVQMDPEDSVTHIFELDNLIRGELVKLTFPEGSIPF